jgi:DNA-binding transcriptional MerR regulator
MHTVGMVPPLSTEELTIHALSERTGVPITTLRMYQQRRLIEPPVRRGRVGLYGPSHVERLTLIDHLQTRGYSLAAIVDLIDRAGTGSGGTDLQAVVGEAIPALGAEQPVRMTLPELIHALPIKDFTLDLVKRCQDLGLVELSGDGVIVNFPSFLRVGQTLAQLNVPGQVIIDAYEKLREEMGSVADDFATMFDQHIGQTSDLVTQGKQLEQLAEAAIDVVTTELRRALRAKAEERLAATNLPSR